MDCYYTADPTDDQAFTQALADAALHCHNDVLKRSDAAAGSGMATTLTLMLFVWPRAYLLQVGDSRYYLLRDGELTQISRDQTLAQVLVDDGVFSRTEASKSPLSNVLSSDIGGSETTHRMFSCLQPGSPASTSAVVRTGGRIGNYVHTERVAQLPVAHVSSSVRLDGFGPSMGNAWGDVSDEPLFLFHDMSLRERHRPPPVGGADCNPCPFT